MLHGLPTELEKTLFLPWKDSRALLAYGLFRKTTDRGRRMKQSELVVLTCLILGAKTPEY